VLAALALAACNSGPPTTGTTPRPAASPLGSAPPAGSVPNGEAATLQQTFIDVVRRVRPSVVQIETSSGLGSGVVFDSGGDVVTNAHVVGSATSCASPPPRAAATPPPRWASSSPTTSP